MAKVVAIGQPVNDSERSAIAFLRDNLPASYTVLHNLELAQGTEIFEIDLVLLTPHGVFVVDAKGTQGAVDIIGAKWYPQDRQPYHSPLAKLRQHAKVLKTLICDAYPQKYELRRVHVHAAVLMTAPDVAVTDYGNLDGADVTKLDNCIAYFTGKAHIPPDRADDIRTLLATIETAIRGKAKPKQQQLRFRDWLAEEKLGGDDRYTEYRARNTFVGKSNIMARLRVYHVDPYKDAVARATELNLISNAFKVVAQMPPHSNILAVREFFGTEDGDKIILVTEDITGQALRQHIKKPTLALTFDQKLRVLHDVLTALDHAHRHAVVHRNLSPDSILIGAEGGARLAAFDYARIGQNRQSTIAGEVVEDLDTRFQAPECYRDPAQATPRSDLFSAGLIFYELLTGEPAFLTTEKMVDSGAMFPVKASDLKPDLPAGIDKWLQKLCSFDPATRPPDAAHALSELMEIFTPADEHQTSINATSNEQAVPSDDLLNLPRDYVLGNRFYVQERLGNPGGFAVAYKVYDSFGDAVCVLKLITRDRYSVLERLRKEYSILRHLPKHPHVVDVIWADRLPDETPYIVFEYVAGLDVERQISNRAFSIEDAVRLAREVAQGLEHLHRNGVYHQDIKPSNLLWTGEGVRIIDFNVSVSDADQHAGGGGTRRYIPPDLDISVEAEATAKIDRDVYALAVTFYEILTGNYPFEEKMPPAGKLPRDPRDFPGCEDFSDKLVNFLYKALAPKRIDRFPSAPTFMMALAAVGGLKKLKPQFVSVSIGEPSVAFPLDAASVKPNYNPFVTYLLTLYSQSQHTNAGTRGLDRAGEAIYVSTLLDTHLQPAVLSGEFNLVIISGNAGDGKTAFVQQLERQAEREGANMRREANGATFELQGRTFITNLDGSQDEGEKINDDVLLDFFHPFDGAEEREWGTQDTRVIAINEGRLVDFLSDYEQRFPRLTTIVKNGLRGSDPEAGVALINLNLRSVVADVHGENSSIFDRLVRRMTAPKLWEACKSCDIKDRCYIYHNAQTFMDQTAGPKVIERLKTLHAVTHLRGRLHVTLRDLRSALAFMIAGTRDCDDVHELYRNSDPQALQEILSGYYFNAWMGGVRGSEDRLISLLREIDVGAVSNPELDRTFALLSPDDRELSRFSFTERNSYADDLLRKRFTDLPVDFSAKIGTERRAVYKRYVAMARRRHYFERRDEGWRQMLPHASASEFLQLVSENMEELHERVSGLLTAINRGEGLRNPMRLEGKLALRVRQVNKGTIRSYRLFDQEAFSFECPILAGGTQFIEYLPQKLLLRYQSATGGHSAILNIFLDVYEMLLRLNEGYRPSIEQQEGFYRNLAVFKNLLGSAPYQEVLLTETGHDFYRINREETGVLSLERLRGTSSHEHQNARQGVSNS